MGDHLQRNKMGDNKFLVSSLGRGFAVRCCCLYLASILCWPRRGSRHSFADLGYLSFLQSHEDHHIGGPPTTRLPGEARPEPDVPLPLLFASAYTTNEFLHAFNYSEGSPVEVFSPELQPEYGCYKIPYLFQTINGTLLAFAEARGPKDDPASLGNCMDWDVTDVVVRKSYDGGNTWSKMHVLLQGRSSWHFVVGNLAPVQNEYTGRVFLPFTRGNSRMWMTYSDNNGESWVEPYRIPLEGYWWTWVGFGPPAGLQMSYSEKYRGRLLIPGYVSDAPIFDLTAIFGSSAFVLLSDDHGKTWEVVMISNGNQELWGIAGNEDQLAENCDGSLLLNSRTWIGDRAQARSTDGGKTWTSQDRIQLPNPFQGCQGSLISLNKHTLLYSGVSRYSESALGATRADLTLWYSTDKGENWFESHVFHKGGGSYSAMQRLLDGRLAITYEVGDLSAIFIPLKIYVAVLPPALHLGASVGIPKTEDSMSCPSGNSRPNTLQGLFSREPRRFFYADTGPTLNAAMLNGTSSTVAARGSSSSTASLALQHWPQTWNTFKVHDMSWHQKVKSNFSTSFMFCFWWWVVVLFAITTTVLSAMVAFVSATCCCFPVCAARQKNAPTLKVVGPTVVGDLCCAGIAVAGRKYRQWKDKDASAAGLPITSSSASTTNVDSPDQRQDVEIVVKVVDKQDQLRNPPQSPQDATLQEPRNDSKAIASDADFVSVVSAREEHRFADQPVVADPNAVLLLTGKGDVESGKINVNDSIFAINNMKRDDDDQNVTGELHHLGNIEEVPSTTSGTSSVTGDVGAIDLGPGAEEKHGGFVVAASKLELVLRHVEADGEPTTINNFFHSISTKFPQTSARLAHAYTVFHEKHTQYKPSILKYGFPCFQLLHSLWFGFWWVGIEVALFFAHDDPIRWLFQTNNSILGLTVSILVSLAKMHYCDEPALLGRRMAERVVLYFGGLVLFGCVMAFLSGGFAF
ncbi:unnamed protein product [Amoebophrya sp. A25]|nr:unnamed protein product [Amoebophrya sp. A25]|eukprot:GSA25T00004890001.1